MSDLTDVKFFLASLLRPIVREAIREEINSLNSSPTTAPDADPYGDFHWLCNTCPGVPASTLRVKSAAGEIPGVIKFGKRVLYEKAAVLNWLRSQTRQTVDMVAVEEAAALQVNNHPQKRRGKGLSA